MSKRKPTNPPPGCKSPAEARAALDECGISAAEWARTHKVSKGLVYRLLAGGSPGLRGQSHRAAVLLGLKPGRLDVSAKELIASAITRKGGR